MDPYLSAGEDGLRVQRYGSWTAKKLDYLQRYLGLFVTSMRRQPFRAKHYIDLFAGPGKCRTGVRSVALGSPLIALTARYAFDRYFFVERDAGSIHALETRCAASPDFGRVTLLHGEAGILVHDIVGQIGAVDSEWRPDIWSSLNLAFLDPEGPKELPWSMVEALAGLNRMDLIIHYSEVGINRLRDNCVDAGGETVLDRFFGGDGWRDVYRKARGRRGVHRALMDHYKSQLTALGYVDVQSTDEPLMRNQAKNAPLYRLIFASKHERGNDFWQAVLKRDLYGQGRLLEAAGPY